jgi:uncharacterized integral membrane protein
MGERQMFPVQTKPTRTLTSYAGSKEVNMANEVPGSHEASSARGNGWRIASAIAIVLLLWFAIANSASTEVHFWVVSVHSPLIVVIVASALLGAFTVALWNRARPRR